MRSVGSSGPKLSSCGHRRLWSDWGGCQGWSESSLGAHAFWLVLSWGGSIILFHNPLFCVYVISFGPRQANLLLIAYASSEGSGEPAHPRSLARTSALAHTSRESRGTFRQKPRSLAPLNGWACAVKICHDGMLEDTNSLDAVHL